MAIIPLEDPESVELHQISAQTEPCYQGWYVGRNENNLPEAITVSRAVRQVKDFCFTTLLFPVTGEAELPDILRTQDGTVTVNFRGKKYSFSLSHLNQ